MELTELDRQLREVDTLSDMIRRSEEIVQSYRDKRADLFIALHKAGATWSTLAELAELNPSRVAEIAANRERILARVGQSTL